MANKETNPNASDKASDKEREATIPRPNKEAQAKRVRELARQAKHKAKEERRMQRKEEKDLQSPGDDGEDPDLAGIIPGPQPPQT